MILPARCGAFNSRPVFRNVTRARPCPKCQKPDQCSVDEEGDYCCCFRIAEGGKEKTAEDGRTYWVHRLTPYPERADAWPAPRFSVADGKGELAEADVLDRVYRKLLDSLRLEPVHQAALAKRKFPRMHAEPKGYRSIGKGRATAVQAIVRAGLEQHLPRVPGFVVKEKDGKRYWTLAGWGGMAIPVRDAMGKVVALQVRLDDPEEDGGKYRFLSSKHYDGPGPGSPVHHPIFDGDKTLSRVTEGALKADVATHLSGVFTLGLPSVGTWRRAAAALMAIGAKTVRVAFDADACANYAVGNSLRLLVNDLAGKGFAVELERWAVEDGKGIDDLLAAGKQPDVITGEAVGSVVASIVAEAEKADPGRGRPAPPPPPAEQAARAAAAIQSGHANEEDDDPHRLARVFLQLGEDASPPRLRFWREEWHQWDGAAYRPVGTADVRARLNLSIKRELDRLNRMELMEYNARPDHGERDRPPTAAKVTAALETNAYRAMCGMALLDAATEPPAWIGGPAPHPPGELIAARNGLAHLPTFADGRPGFMLDHSPSYFVRNSLGYDFDPSAPEPRAWLDFLATLWPDDRQAVELLQEWFGYCLTPDTRQGKILFMVGPPRSGKGTIMKLLRAIVGQHNTCAPTLSSLGKQFGLWPLLDKSLAIIGDARLSGKSDLAEIVERLLSISGEDSITIDRKCLPSVTCRLPVRFVVVSNELPRLPDASGALANRLVILELTQSFLGREDHALEGRLLPELPGILLWAIEGWNRLRQRGRFVRPDSSRELAEELEDLTSPVSAFVREQCVRGPSESTPCRVLFDEWRKWCEQRGQSPGNDAVFGRNLRAAFPSIRSKRPREGEGRTRHYEGVGLRTPFE